MVKLEKKLLRKVDCESQWLRGTEVVLTITPHPEGAYLSFHEPRYRAKYKISLKEAFRQAVLITTAKIAARTKELRKAGVRGAAKKASREFLR
jgi:hypothetical protein